MTNGCVSFGKEENDLQQAAQTGINRRGSKDSRLR